MRGGACGRDAKMTMGQSLPGWWTGLLHASSDCEVGGVSSVDAKMIGYRRLDRDQIRFKKTRCKKCSSILRRVMGGWIPHSCSTFVASLTTCGHPPCLLSRFMPARSCHVRFWNSAHRGRKNPKPWEPAQASGAKARIILESVTARLKPCPSRTTAEPFPYSLFFGRS